MVLGIILSALSLTEIQWGVVTTDNVPALQIEKLIDKKIKELSQS